MAYTTATKTRELLTGVNTSIMSDVDVAKHIARADSVIDAKLAGIYSVPFETTPPVIETISTYLSAYYVGITLFTRDRGNENKWIDKLKEEAVELLKAVIEGSLIVVNSSGGELTRTTSGVKSNTKDYTPIFDVDDIENSAVDADRLSDIEDARE